MKLLVSAILTLSFFAVPIHPPVVAASSACNQALLKSKKQLGSVKTLKMAAIPPIKGKPPGRSTEVNITLTSDSPMQNTALQLALSKTIMQKCRTVGSVHFGLDETDWAITYGLIKGRVQQFKCKEAGVNQNLRWGEQYCF